VSGRRFVGGAGRGSAVAGFPRAASGWYEPYMRLAVDVPVFAVRLLPSGCWEVLAPVAHELSGRHGLRRLARVPSVLDVSRRRPAGSVCVNRSAGSRAVRLNEPVAAAADGSKVIWLKDRAGDWRAWRGH